MPNFPAELPPAGQNVQITLTTGGSHMAYHDGSQWWMGIPDEPEDVPIVNGFVASWELIS